MVLKRFSRSKASALRVLHFVRLYALGCAIGKPGPRLAVWRASLLAQAQASEAKGVVLKSVHIHERSSWQLPITVTKSVRKSWLKNVKKKTSSRAKPSAKSGVRRVNLVLMTC